MERNIEHRPERTMDRDAIRAQRRKKMIMERRRKRRQMVMVILSILALLVVLAVGALLFWIFRVDHLEEGTILYEAGSYAEALVEFEEQIETEKSLDEAYLGVALCNWELENYEEMEVAFEMAYIYGATKTGASRNMLASVALQEENYESALVYIQEGLTLTGNSNELTQELLRNEIVCYEMLYDWDTAREKMSAYLEAYPNDEEAAEEAEFLETR